MIKVKVCGITNIADALLAAESGADAIGFIFYKPSPRYIAPELARDIIDRLPPFINSVAVFVDEDEKRLKDIIDLCRIDTIQLHGDESPGFCERFKQKVIKTIRVQGEESLRGLDRYQVSAFLLDTYRENIPGGTGRSFDWDLAIGVKRYGPIILAGGLNPENVADATRKVKPYGVDVSSGVEKSPGKKDADKLKRFIERVRKADDTG